MEEHAELKKETGFTSSFPPALEYEGVRYPPRVITSQTLDRLKTFEVREDDLILTSYPKCGTHWIQEILLLIQQDGHVEMVNRDVDPALNWDLAFGLPPDFENSVADSLATRPSPRFYKTHLPSQHLPSQVWSKKAKLVYVTRDPKDACASFFNFTNANPEKPFDIQWDMFFDLFMSDKAIFGNWVDHALGYWQHRNDGHVFFITFEEMKEDIRSVIRRLATFLGKTISPEGLERIVEHSSLEGMKRTYAKIEEEVENGKLYTRAYGLMSFVQKGVPGGWKALFSEEQKENMDKAMKERLVGTGLDAHYPLKASM
ncbi:Sulfotransferase family cytosolic 1B member 1 [Holothuria leucospilota]|uniref:Sulfotransferase family cytosolic 1B member 1 n=1 Tax=Holothuria leucospilota TaxID=206669 RepID=A0A9Q1C7Y7_HOLLE|nr:Sulfotransferase family cytosolic 1B member 1 [Holothuria leucospilota]